MTKEEVKADIKRVCDLLELLVPHEMLIVELLNETNARLKGYMALNSKEKAEMGETIAHDVVFGMETKLVLGGVDSFQAEIAHTMGSIKRIIDDVAK